MLDPLNETNLRDHLAAFADGELDAAQAAAVWAYLADEAKGPAAIRWLADHQQVNLVARRVLNVPAPAEVRDRISAMIASEPSSAPPSSLSITGNHWPRRIGYALAMAAAMAIAVTVSNSFLRQAPVANVLPPELVTMISRVHGECSRLPEHLHDAHFDETDPQLAKLTQSDLGGNGAPDLTSAGFRFIGAGPCPASKIHTVHLLYRSTRPQALAAVSMFVQADTGQFPALKPGHVYRVSSPTSPYPTLAWRSGKVIYFLLADDDRTESSVLQTVHPTPAVDIVTVAD
ncbi:MAG: hypothetical protein JWM57_2807 [Phycisphaerales bacterium]|nr:hypothetical protein [Phycisphaerales bacterium]